MIESKITVIHEKDVAILTKICAEVIQEFLKFIVSHSDKSIYKKFIGDQEALDAIDADICSVRFFL